MSTVRFATICDLCGKRSAEYARFACCIDCGADVCPACEVGISYQNDPDRCSVVCFKCAEPEEPECACVQIDVDMDDNRDCPAHGPNSEMAKRNRHAEAQADADSAARIGILLGFEEEAAQ